MRIVTFDLDGVLAEGGYLPPEARTSQNFLKLTPLVEGTVLIDVVGGLEAWVVTSRAPEARPATMIWLRKWFPNCFERVLCVGGGKVDVVKSIHPILHVDDDVGVVEALLQPPNAVDAAVLFDNPSNPTNQSDTHLLRVMGWGELLTLIKSLKEFYK